MSSLSSLSSKSSNSGGSSSSGSGLLLSSSSSSSKEYATKSDLDKIILAIAEIQKIQLLNSQLPSPPTVNESKQPVKDGMMAGLRAAVASSSPSPLKPAIRVSTSAGLGGANTVNAKVNEVGMSDGSLPNPDDDDDDDNGDGEDKEVVLTSVAQYRNIKNNYQGLWMNWYRMNNIRDGKADREVRTICMAIDAFIKEGCEPGHSQGLEILCSRLAGLIIINEGKIKNAYQVADHLEYKPIDVMIPYSNLTRAVKTSKLYEKVGGSPSGNSQWGSSKKKEHHQHKSKQSASGGGSGKSNNKKSSSIKKTGAGGTGTLNGAVSTGSSS